MVYEMAESMERLTGTRLVEVWVVTMVELMVK